MERPFMVITIPDWAVARKRECERIIFSRTINLSF